KMAFDIVRQKKNRTSRDPGKRSRLRDIEEVCDVFKNNKGTHKVEGIMFDLSQKGDLHVQADTFNKMTKLKFLRLYVPLRKKRLATVYHPEDMLPFSGKLIYLEWNGCPLKSLPHPFCVELLVEIHLQHSNVEYLWHGRQELLNLELINLSESKQLMELPDLSGTTKLKKLYLSGCESLREVHPSVFSKDTLVILLVDRCKNLESLVSEKHLTSLRVISISGCSSLREFSLSGDLIKKLNLSNINIEILHASISYLSNHDLMVLRLKNLPKAMSCLRSITKLELSNCNIITKSMLEAIFDDLESSERLKLTDSKDWWQWCSSPECLKEEFRRFFRMSKATFEFICNELNPAVMKKNTMLHDAIPVRKHVAVCISRLATGDALRIVSKRFGLGISTCHKLVLESLRVFLEYQMLVVQCILLIFQ
ncbi:disease resistance protein, partial [Trifolium medium]|nr:disease resistance protein [Trifolium medium]